MLGPAAQVLGRTATRRGCEELRERLQAALRSVLETPADHPELRAACDRVIRACIQRLGDSEAGAGGGGEGRGHLSSLLRLAALACDGHRACSGPGGRCAPLYLERLVFHLLRAACPRGLPPGCEPLCQLLLAGLSESSRPEALGVARSAFALLWGAAPSLPQGPGLSLRLRALRLLALDHSSSALLAQRFAQSCRLYLQGGGGEGPSLSGETLSLLRGLLTPPPLEQGRHQHRLALCCQLALQAASSLSKAGFPGQTRELLQGASSLVRGEREAEDSPFLGALQLARLSPGLRAPPLGPGQTLSRALGTLRSVGDSPGPPGRRALAAGCRFLLSELRLLAERAGGRGGEEARSPGPRELLQLSTFLHVYLEQEVSSTPDAGTLKICYQNLDLFTRAVYEFLMDPEAADSDGAEQLLSPSKQIVEKMVEVEEGLVSHRQTDYIGATGLRLYNLAYGFYSRKLFGEAAQMAVMLRGDTHPPDLFSRSPLPPDRVPRFYKLLVQCYRKLGELEKAMEAVGMWLMALGDQRSGQETEPIALWACLKADAVNSGNEELQLRTLKDTLQPWGVQSPWLTELLQEELRAYKGLQTDTSRERFNVICDLLQLCSPPGPEAVTEPGTQQLRAVQLLELAQLLCYRDFTQHTECSAMDCVEEALAILGSLKEIPENREQLLDDRANAYLWRYVCDLESRIREGVERCQRLGSIPETGLEPEGGDPNDMDYEEKQQGALSVHDHIDFNLTAESKRCESLDEALSLWKRLLLSGSPPTLRNPEQTAQALHLTAALYRLMDKPFQVIESYGLLLRLLEPREDALPVANVLLQLGETLLSVHCLGPVQTCLDRAELLLDHVDSGKGGLLLAKTTCTLLRSHLLWATSRVPEGLALLSEVLACPSLHKPSKVWYLLKAKLQQLVAAYLSLAPSALPPSQRRNIQQHGWMTPESALTDAHKMLCGIIMLLCPGMLPFGKGGSELNCPLNPGDNLSQKWQVLSNLLSCSGRMVSLLTALGSAQEAKMFCLETLRLTAKLHCVRPCVEFLVASAELEGLRGDLQARDLDLRLVQHLLEPSADFLQERRPRAGTQIHPQKARAPGPPSSSSSSLPTPAAREEGEEGQGESPPPAAALLRARPLSLLEMVTSVPGGAASGSPSLGGSAPNPDPLHPEECPCPVCGDPSLTGSCLRWALLRARAGAAPSLETVRRRCRERGEAFSRSLLGLALQALGRPCPQPLPSDPGLYPCLEARAYSQGAPACPQEARAWFSSKPAGPWQLEQARASLLLALASQERGFGRLLPPPAPASSAPPPAQSRGPRQVRKAPRPAASSSSSSTATRGRPRAPARSGPRTRLRKRFDDSDLEPEGEEEEQGGVGKTLPGREGRGWRGTAARRGLRGEAVGSKAEDRLEADEAADLDPVYRCLSEACSAIRHCPPSSLYPQLCQLLALCVPGGDAYTTAYLLSESVAVTARHQMMQSLHRKSQKLRKERSRDVTESLQGLSLSGDPETDPDCEPRARYLSEMESLFGFSVSTPARWPQDDVQLFKERLSAIPDDVTVCLLTLTSLNPRGDREELLQLTRLRKDRVPVTVGIPARVSPVLSEFDSILADQREISNETELKAWWDGRTSLDRRMRALVESLERDVLGCWKGLLLTAPPDPRVDSEAAAVCGLLVGPKDSPRLDDELLKAMLGASSVLSDSDVQSLADRLCGAKGQKVLPRLQAAVHTLRCLPTDPPRTCSSQLVLILDKHLQRLPWESIPTLRAHRVSRLPSFQFLLAYVAASKLQLRSVLTEGLNPSRVYYVLNPQGNLPNTEKTFKDWFRRRPGWEGVVGRGPSEGKLKSVLCNRDLYLYAGHGAGVRFLEGQEVQKLSCRAASLLLGCSSAALALRGDLEGVGILLKYMMAGCPLFLGNLWDVTDKDIDRYMDRLLRGWLEAGSQTSLLEYVAHARTAPKLKYLIGASPVVYGLSVSLQ